MVQISSFDFTPEMEICNKYVVKEQLGAGWEGEVYRIVEKTTGIERAAKFFFPHRNIKNKTAVQYAKLLHKLSGCPIVIHYQTHEFITYEDMKVTALISEYVEGELLTTFLERQPGKHIGIFRGLQLLHALASGLESMHNLRVSHGDLHASNVIVKRYGLGFDLKILDMFQRGRELKNHMIDDICDSIRIFYDAIGGAKKYKKHPVEIKQIILGLKRSLIAKKFKSAAHLREYLESIEWTSSYRE
jgi:tRNA A-37 threonylcarbamoyl transferase component Bud32